MLTKTSEKAQGCYTKATNKPKGRAAKRMGFYALNRRKAQGRSVLKQIQAVMTLANNQEYPQGVSLPLVRDEWDSQNLHTFHYGENVMSSTNLAGIESARSLHVR